MRNHLSILLLLVLIALLPGCRENTQTVPKTTPAPVNNTKTDPVTEPSTNSNNSGTTPATTPDVEEPAKAPSVSGSLSTKKLSWYFIRNTNHEVTSAPANIKSMLAKHNAFYVLPNQGKRIYLTFDEGYELGYSGQILDTLKANQVPAAFFITGQYINSQPDLVKRMAAEGHQVCNHTWNHPDLTTVSEKTFRTEILSLEKAYRDLTGNKLAPFLRPPMGNYSEKTLAEAATLGYSTVFWSMAFKDWVVTEQPGAQYSHDHVLANIHPGAVILLHAVSQSNMEALDSIIKDLKAQGYVFSPLPVK